MKWQCKVPGCEKGVPYTDWKLCEAHAREHHPTCCYASPGDFCFCHVQPACRAPGSEDQTNA